MIVWPCLWFGSWYLGYRTIDNWRMSLRREWQLLQIVHAIETGGDVQAAHDSLLRELQTQERYRRTRWWWQCAPSVGKPWVLR
jgi:hypothetical protein